MKLSYFYFKVELTWSKIMALLILVDASYLDVYHKANGTLFMFALPFVVALIGGKQVTDAVKEIRNSIKKDDA